MSREQTCSLILRSWFSSGVLVVVFLTMLVAGRTTFAAENTAAENPTEDLGQGVQKFRNTIAKSMTQAAFSAGVPILTDEIAVATRGDVIVANALVAPRKEAPEKQEQISFVYLSFPSSDACFKILPAGFYTINTAPESARANLRAQLVNAERKVVAEFPLNNEMMMGKPDPTVSSVVLFAEASIEQSQVNMSSARIAVHRTICFPSGVWYWTWIVIS